MAYPLDFCDAPISCHAWNADGTQLALCPNTSELQIYKVTGKTFEILYTLTEHTQVISSVDWNHTTGQIVTCSHDRNAYVWALEGSTWKKDLVILKLDRAATYVRWSPDGTKFVVATGSSKFRVCAFNPEQNWWQSFTISHDHPTSLTVDWLPDNLHVVCSATDRHCRYCTINEEELPRKKGGKDGKKKKAEFVIQKFSSQGWTNASAVSPSATWVALTSQDSWIRFVKDSELSDPKAPTRSLNINGLPLLALAFLSDTVLVGGGFDCQPRLFAYNGTDWEDLGLIDTPAMRDTATAGGGGGGIASRSAAFGGKVVAKTDTIHSNVILGIRVIAGAFTTCANDGRIGFWPFKALNDNFKGKVAL
jgi:actin related protein 2/3 complex subunit 1A/1B